VNDPDCLLVRPETHLTLAEVQTLATVISLTGGSLLLSDHLPTLPPDRLRLVQTLLPPIGLRPHILDWFDSTTPQRLRLDLEDSAGPYHLLALFNWKDNVQDDYLRLEDYAVDSSRSYFARDFWNGDVYLLSDEPLKLQSIPTHGVILLAIRPASTSHPQYLGSNLHISQGLELTEWCYTPPSTLRLQLTRPGHIQGHFDLKLSTPPRLALLDKQNLSWKNTSSGYYRFYTEFNEKAELHITW
jgi:alpha-galactosidase